MQSKRKTARRRLIGSVAVVFMTGCVWFGVHTTLLIWRGLAVDARSADAIVVLGNKVERDGAPSPRLQRRLDCAARLYQERLAPVIVVSGGLGREGFLEAEVMREALIAPGVTANEILVDNGGADTFRSARNARHMLKERGLGSVIIVSSFYHLMRARMIFARFGFDEVSSAPAPLAWEWRDVYSVLREFPAFYYYRLRPIEK